MYVRMHTSVQRREWALCHVSPHTPTCSRYSHISYMIRSDVCMYVRIRICIVPAYFCLSCHQLFPLLIVNDQAHGGYKFDDNEIAIMITLAAGGQILFQVLYSHLASVSHLPSPHLPKFLFHFLPSPVPLLPPGDCVPVHSEVHWV